MNTCETCKYWERSTFFDAQMKRQPLTEGTCLNITYCVGSREDKAWCSEMDATFVTRPTFGCTEHEPKETP
jgi:hypothetical protein